MDFDRNENKQETDIQPTNSERGVLGPSGVCAADEEEVAAAREGFELNICSSSSSKQYTCHFWGSTIKNMEIPMLPESRAPGSEN